MSSSIIVSGGFAETIRRAGLQHVRFHDLRHAYASALMHTGVHPKVVSEALGHASVAFTVDVYSHVVRRCERRPLRRSRSPSAVRGQE